MAHFAKLGLNNKVLAIHGLDNDQMTDANGNEDEVVGINRLTQIHGWALWKKCSWNTKGGKHYTNGVLSDDQTKAFRGNYPGIGWTYDEDNDIFYEPKPHASWTLNTTTATWEAPVVYPTVLSYQIDWEDENGNMVPADRYYVIQWDEANSRWVAALDDGSNTSTLTWNTETSAWDAI